MSEPVSKVKPAEARQAARRAPEFVALPDPGDDPILPLQAAWRGATHDTRRRFCREIRSWFEIYQGEWS